MVALSTENIAIKRSLIVCLKTVRIWCFFIAFHLGKLSYGKRL